MSVVLIALQGAVPSWDQNVKQTETCAFVEEEAAGGGRYLMTKQAMMSLISSAYNDMIEICTMNVLGCVLAFFTICILFILIVSAKMSNNQPLFVATQSQANRITPQSVQLNTAYVASTAPITNPGKVPSGGNPSKSIRTLSMLFSTRSSSAINSKPVAPVAAVSMPAVTRVLQTSSVAPVTTIPDATKKKRKSIFSFLGCCSGASVVPAVAQSPQKKVLVVDLSLQFCIKNGNGTDVAVQLGAMRAETIELMICMLYWAVVPSPTTKQSALPTKYEAMSPSQKSNAVRGLLDLLPTAKVHAKNYLFAGVIATCCLFFRP